MTTATAILAQDTQDDLDLAALLSELDDDGDTETETEDDLDCLDGLDDEDGITAADAVDEDIDLDSIIGEVEMQETREAAYQEQDAATAQKREEQPPAEPADPTKTKTKAKSTKPNTSGMTPSETIVAKFGESIYDTFILSESDADLDSVELKEVIDARVKSVDPLPKKIAEKVLNMLQSLNGGAALSTYTRLAISLFESSNEVTAKDIQALYLKRPYTQGTASAQSSQMMQLLPFMGIASRAGNTLTLRSSSVLYQALTAIVEAPEAETAEE